MDGSSSAVNRTLPSSLVRRDSKKVACWKLPDGALLFWKLDEHGAVTSSETCWRRAILRFNQFTGEPSGHCHGND